MPEREGRPGEGGREREYRPPYVDARRFPDQETAARAYTEGQEALRRDTNHADVSIYRLKIGPELVNHVVALGDPPPAPLKEQLDVAFGSGERVSLPPDILAHLALRRAQAKQVGPWVEGHYRPGKPVWLPHKRRPS